MKRLVEIRSYILCEGCVEAFESLFKSAALPMLHRWQVGVVTYGRSAHDPRAWYLIRAYDDLAHRQASQDAFYGSDEWRNGPREALLAMIESYQDTVLWLSPSSIADLAALNG